MNWEANGAIGQMLGSIAVFVTLGYLAMQVRDNTAMNLRNMIQKRGERTSADFLRAPYLAPIQVKIWIVDGSTPITKALKARYQLTDEEAVRWTRHQLTMWGASWRIGVIRPKSETAIWKASCASN